MDAAKLLSGRLSDRTAPLTAPSLRCYYRCDRWDGRALHPVDAWFRSFDYRRWEYWASNADLGWGGWSVESGWTQGWITTVLALRQLDTSLWDLTADSGMAEHLETYRTLMLPESDVS